MNPILTYLVRSALCMGAFYTLYKLFMSRTTLYRLNRAVLLTSLVLSIALPLCIINFTIHIQAPEVVESIEEFGTVATPSASVATATEGNPLFSDLLIWIYLLGGSVAAAAAMVSALQMARLIRNSELLRRTRLYTLLLSRSVRSPLSWFRLIVIGSRDDDSAAIIAHESAHVAMHHSVDMLFANICCAVFWFNPFVWLLRRELQSVHEFQADQAVIETGIDAQQYQLLLIKKAVGTSSYTVANSLNHSTLKKRITMMLSKKSPRRAAFGSLSLLPVVCLALVSFATTTKIYVADNKGNKIIDSLQQPKDSIERYDIVIEVNNKGTEMKINSKKLDIDNLTARSNKESITLMIKASPDTPMGVITDLKQNLRKNGLMRIGYAIADNTNRTDFSASNNKGANDAAAQTKSIVVDTNKQPDTDDTTKDRNIMEVFVNSKGRIMANRQSIVDHDGLQRAVEEFITNPEQKNSLSEQEPFHTEQETAKPLEAINRSRGTIALTVDRDTPYSEYIAVQKSIVGAFESIRNRCSETYFSLPFDQLDSVRQNELRRAVPVAIYETEMHHR